MNLISIYIFFPFILEFIIKYILAISEWSVIVIAILMPITFSVLFSLLKHRTKILKIIYLLIAYLPISINISHILIFNSEISCGAFMSMFATNIPESVEFIDHVMSKKIIIFELLYWLVFSVLFFNSQELRFKAEKYKKTLITLFVILYPIFCFGDQRYRFPFEKVLFPYIEYHIDIIKNKKILNNRKNFVFHDIKSYIDKNEPELYVIVIGESSNRNHMSVYKNELKTTPYFDSIKDEFKIFDKIKSKYCSTLKAIKHIFLLNEKFENGDIITLFKQAGFKTFWISNQYALENNENITSIIATLSDVKVFINKAHYRPKLSSSYDESVVNYLQKVVLDKARKKVVFIHLLGSHFPYAKRYPKNFDIFKSEKPDKRSKEIAEYNNSILYTDYVLFKILNVIKNQSTNSYMLYFSDHAEDITDDPKSPHVHSDDIRTEEMFNIPFIVWLSPKYKSLNNDFVKYWNIHAECYPVDILHSIIDLSRMSCKEYNKSKSIFSMK